MDSREASAWLAGGEERDIRHSIQNHANETRYKAEMIAIVSHTEVLQNGIVSHISSGIEVLGKLLREKFKGGSSPLIDQQKAGYAVTGSRTRDQWRAWRPAWDCLWKAYPAMSGRAMVASL